jgi:hypothetical protein
MGPEFGFSPAKTYQFWDLSQRKVISNIGEDDQSQHLEKMLELYQFTLSVNKKKLVGDLTSCFVLLSQHALYRMIQRGLVEREPLQHMSDNLFDWLRHVAHILYSYSSTAGAVGERFLIPYSNGALLGNIGRTNRLNTIHGCSIERLRFQDGIMRSVATQPPYRSTLEVEDEVDVHYTFKISTWIPEAYFSSEQFWARNRLQELDDKYHKMFCSLTWLLMPHYTVVANTKTKSINESMFSIQDYQEEMLSIVTDPRWLLATGSV